MEFHLNRRVRLSVEGKNKSLYSWSLQEVSDSGEQVGRDQVPWQWSVMFSARQLRYIRTLRITRAGNADDTFSPTENEVSSTNIIRGLLQPGLPIDEGDFEREATFSMFGTDRTIQKFNLFIRQLEEDGSEDSCILYGGVSYTSEVDFETQTEDDSLELTVAVSQERFEQLRDLVVNIKPDIFVVRLGRVDGFYSDWSPSIRTSRIKVLTRGSEHKVEVPDGCEVEPPRLGDVGEFELTATSRRTLERPIDN